jgi:hypothetical protein
MINFLPLLKHRNMKKVIALLSIAVCFTVSSAMAQGGGQQMSAEERTAMMKERLKDITLTPAQTDSVIAIYSDRSAFGNMREMSPEDRAAKMKEVGEARIKRMEKAGIPAETAKKVADALAPRQRPSGGGGDRK